MSLRNDNLKIVFAGWVDASGATTSRPLNDISILTWSGGDCVQISSVATGQRSLTTSARTGVGYPMWLASS